MNKHSPSWAQNYMCPGRLTEYGMHFVFILSKCKYVHDNNCKENNNNRTTDLVYYKDDCELNKTTQSPVIN